MQPGEDRLTQPARQHPQGLEAADSAKSAGTISTIAFAAGGALIVGGLLLFLTAPKSTRATVGAIGPGFTF